MPSLDPIPDGFAVRAPTVDDAEAIADLINEVSVAEAGIPWTTTEETRDLAVVAGASGAVAGRAPDRRGRIHRGIPGVLDLGHNRALARGVRSTGPLGPRPQHLAHPARRGVGQRGSPRIPLAVRVAALALPQQRGRGPALRVARLPLRPDLLGDARGPRGISRRGTERSRCLDPDVRPRHRRRARVRGAPRGVRRPLGRTVPQPRALAAPEHRRRRRELRSHALVRRGGRTNEVVGAICCTAITPRADDTGEVGYLAVRRPWRRRGVALALLLSAFAELDRRGIARCELSVDSENPTGATKLYERAGMQVAYGWDVWEKTLGRASDGPQRPA